MLVCSSLLWTLFLYLFSLLTPSFHCLLLCVSPGRGVHLNCSPPPPPPFLSLGCICPVRCLVHSLLISVLFLLLSAFSLWSLHLSHSLQHSFLPTLSFCPLPHSAPLPVSLFHSQILMMWFQRPRGWTAAYRRPVPNSQPRAGDSAPLGPAWETVSAQQKVMISWTRRLVPRCYSLILHLLMQPVMIFCIFHTNNVVCLTSA